MHYVTHRSDRMQKYKFGVTYPSVLFCRIRTHLSIKNSASKLRTSDAPECTMGPIDLTGCKNTSSA
jgi:hypothetical protein